MDLKIEVFTDVAEPGIDIQRLLFVTNVTMPSENDR